MTNFVLHDFDPRSVTSESEAGQLPAVLEFANRSVYFITDVGEQLDISQNGEVVAALPRYGVWRRSTGEVVEASDDLPAIIQKYNVPSSQVHVL